MAFQKFSSYLNDSLLRIRKRLGMAHWQALDKDLQHALHLHKNNADTSHHTQWLEPLLKKYYDPLYIAQLGTRPEMIVFRGSYDDCHQYLMHSILKSN